MNEKEKQIIRSFLKWLFDKYKLHMIDSDYLEELFNEYSKKEGK